MLVNHLFVNNELRRRLLKALGHYSFVLKMKETGGAVLPIRQQATISTQKLVVVVLVCTVSDETADVVDVVYVNMQLDLWGALGWVKQQGQDI